jgi:hypothetical protein
VVEVLAARNQQPQSEISKRQASDLRQEAARIRAATKTRAQEKKK